MRCLLPILLVLTGVCIAPACGEVMSKAVDKTSASSAKADAPPAGVPEKALKVLEYVDKHAATMEGYQGGRTFGNFERRLPQNDSKGRRIKYREWDVNPLRPGVNRGPERLVTGSDGTAFYTDDHYATFRKIRGPRDS